MKKCCILLILMLLILCAAPAMAAEIPGVTYDENRDLFLLDGAELADLTADGDMTLVLTGDTVIEGALKAEGSLRISGDGDAGLTVGSVAAASLDIYGVDLTVKGDIAIKDALSLDTVDASVLGSISANNADFRHGDFTAAQVVTKGDLSMTAAALSVSSTALAIEVGGDLQVAGSRLDVASPEDAVHVKGEARFMNSEASLIGKFEGQSLTAKEGIVLAGSRLPNLHVCEDENGFYIGNRRGENIGAAAIWTTRLTPEQKSVRLTKQTVIVNGAPAELEIYNIDGSNYMKLRDLAELLDGTEQQFGIEYDSYSKTLYTTSAAAYQLDDRAIDGITDASASCKASCWVLFHDGIYRSAYVYNIDGCNFFRLKDLADIYGFHLFHDSITGNVFLSDSSYAPAYTLAELEAANRINEGDNRAVTEQEGSAPLLVSMISLEDAEVDALQYQDGTITWLGDGKTIVRYADGTFGMFCFLPDQYQWMEENMLATASLPIPGSETLIQCWEENGSVYFLTELGRLRTLYQAEAETLSLIKASIWQNGNEIYRKAIHTMDEDVSRPAWAREVLASEVTREVTLVMDGKATSFTIPASCRACFLLPSGYTAEYAVDEIASDGIYPDQTITLSK